MLTVAEAFVRSGVRTGRSLVFAGFDVEESGLIGSQALADDPVAVFAPAIGEMAGDALPLPEIGVDQPVHQLADFPFDLLRRVGDDLLLESLLHAAAIEQIHHPADAHRLVEVLVAAALHLEQDAVDVRHAELEVARQVLPIHLELPFDVVSENPIEPAATEEAPAGEKTEKRSERRPRKEGGKE